MFFTKMIKKEDLARVGIEEFADKDYFYVIYLAKLRVNHRDLALLEISMQATDRICVVLESEDRGNLAENRYASALLGSFSSYAEDVPFVGVVLLKVTNSDRFLAAKETQIKAGKSPLDMRKIPPAIGKAIDRIESKVQIAEVIGTRLTASEVRSALKWIVELLIKR